MDQIHLSEPTEDNPEAIVQTTRQRFVDSPDEVPFWILFKNTSALFQSNVYLFSSQFHAEKFVQQKGSPHEFSLLRMSEDLIHGIRRAHPRAIVVVNPCVHCNHQTEFPMGNDYHALLTKLTELLVHQLLVSLDELSTAQDLIEEEEYNRASDLLVKIVTHLNPGLAEAHYLLGAIALGNKADDMVEQVQTNLARMSDKWHDKFVQLREKRE